MTESTNIAYQRRVDETHTRYLIAYKMLQLMCADIEISKEYKADRVLQGDAYLTILNDFIRFTCCHMKPPMTILQSQVVVLERMLVTFNKGNTYVKD